MILKTFAIRARGSRAALLIAAVALSACTTHLKTMPSEQMAASAYGDRASGGAQRGLSYALPMVRYKVKVSRSLSECPGKDADGKATILKFVTKSEVTDEYVAGERFEVDYSAMGSPFKTTSFDIAYHDNGTLKSINAKAKDQTGPILTDVARVGLAVASITAGVPPIGILGNMATMAPQWNLAEKNNAATLIRRQSIATPVVRCTAEAEKKLSDLAAANDELKKRTVKIQTATNAVNRLSTLAGIETLNDKQKTELVDQVTALLQLEADQAATQTAIAGLERDLSASETVVWPNMADARASQVGWTKDVPATTALTKMKKLLRVELGGVDKAVSALFRALPICANGATSLCRTVDVSDAGQVNVTCGSTTATFDACISDRLTVRLALDRIDGGLAPRMPDCTEPATVDRKPKPLDGKPDPLAEEPRLDETMLVSATHKSWGKGIFVREAARGQLTVCEHDDSGAKWKVVWTDDLVVAPQLGRLRFLPFENGRFEDNRIELAMRADGQIEKLSYGEDSSASAASSALATVAEKVDAGLEKMETERRDDIKYARDTVTWQRTEAAAGRAEEVAVLTFQLDQVTKRRDILLAQAGLANAEANTAIEAEKTRLAAEQAVIQSKLAILKAKTELAAGGGT